MGRHAHQPTDVLRAKVLTFSQCGTPETDIATVIGIDPKTLRKHYRRELDEGVITANAKVAQSLYKAATAAKPSQGTVTAQIFWLKTRAGWVDKTRVQVVGKDDGPVQVESKATVDLSTVSTEDLEALHGILTRATGGPEADPD